MKSRLANYGVVFVVLLAVAVSLAYVFGFLPFETRGEREARQYLESMRERYETDTFGGKTPEETLELFISALEAGDIDLASRYFVVDEQEEWRGRLEIGKENDTISDFIIELSKKKNGKMLYEGKYLITTVGDDGKAELVISFLLNKEAGIWKIESL